MKNYIRICLFVAFAALVVVSCGDANQPFTLSDGAQLVLTTGCDVARTGEVFCDDPIGPDVLTQTPLEDALNWIR